MEPTALQPWYLYLPAYAYATAGPPLTRSSDIRRSAIFLYSSMGLRPWFFRLRSFQSFGGSTEANNA